MWIFVKLIKIKGTDLVTIVDDEDFDKLNKYSWRLSNSGYVRRMTTIRINGEKKSKSFTMHREIMTAKEGQIVDHINRDKLDNRKENLRFVTREQSNQNRGISSRNTNGYKGVSLKVDHHKRKRPYEAKIKVNGKSIWLGTYETAIEAALDYDEMALVYHGDYAKLNFPEEY
jgi:hypothetical protein